MKCQAISSLLATKYQFERHDPHLDVELPTKIGPFSIRRLNLNYNLNF